VCAAERLILFLEPSTVDIGALEFHRGAIYMYAAQAAQGMLAGEHGHRSPAAAGQALPTFVSMMALRSELAFEAALGWTPFAAVEQRGRCAARSMAVCIPLRARHLVSICALPVARGCVARRNCMTSMHAGSTRWWEL